jgi:putative tricarboxylic transport membrane protein
MSPQEPGSNAQHDRAHAGGIAREVAAGLFMIGLAAVAWIGGYGLNFGQLSGIGPGLMPKVTATIVAVFGLMLILQGFTSVRDKMEAWSVRGMFFVLGAVLVFAAAVRPLGLLVAGPLAVIISGLADKDSRIVELVIYAIVMTMLCGLMFKEALGLPIPFDPLGLMGPLNDLYIAFKVVLKKFVFGLFGR